MDLYNAKKKWDLDRDWIDGAVKNLGLDRFRSICEEITEYWFKDADGESREDYDEMTLRILDNGTFGFHDDENDRNYVKITLEDGRGPLWWNKIKLIFRNIFPPYQDMRNVKHYHYLDGLPWLLPFFWIYRFYRAIRYRQIENGKRMVEDAAISQSQLSDFEKELNKWGLSASDP